MAAFAGPAAAEVVQTDGIVAGGGTVNFVDRIGRRTIICMLLIVALTVVWNVVGR
jgi:hypothetical protein